MLLNETRDITVRVRDTAQQRFEAGSAPRLEVMQAQLTLASAENEATAAQTASLCRAAGKNILQPQFSDQLSHAPPSVQRGFESFIRSLR
jgi:hypothetical protein